MSNRKVIPHSDRYVQPPKRAEQSRAEASTFTYFEDIGGQRWEFRFFTSAGWLHCRHFLDGVRVRKGPFMAALDLDLARAPCWRAGFNEVTTAGPRSGT